MLSVQTYLEEIKEYFTMQGCFIWKNRGIGQANKAVIKYFFFRHLTATMPIEPNKNIRPMGTTITNDRKINISL